MEKRARSETLDQRMCFKSFGFRFFNAVIHRGGFGIDGRPGLKGVVGSRGLKGERGPAADWAEPGEEG